MKRDKKSKPIADCTMFYCRAVWDDSAASKSLQTLLAKFHKDFPNTSDRDFNYFRNRQVVGNDHAEWTEGLLVHCSTYVPGQHQSTIPIPVPEKQKGEVTAYRPPKERNFLRGDCFILVNKNDVLILPIGVREGTALSYIKSALRKLDEKEIANSLELKKIANLDKYKLIQEIGVTEVDLDASLFDATIEYEEGKNIKNDFIKSIAEALKKRYGKEKTLAELSELDNLHIDLKIRFDGKEAKRKTNSENNMFGVNGRKQLQMLATDTLKEVDDGFKLILRNGQTLTGDEIRIRKPIKLAEAGNSVSLKDAWEALSGFYKSLKKDGVLAQ